MGCIRHPSVSGEFICSVCFAEVCRECAFLSALGTNAYCPNCAVGTNVFAARTVAAPEKPPSKPLTLEAAVAAFPRKQTGRCVQHPSVETTRTCDACHAYMCETCDFTFETTHVCPKCAAAPRTELSDRRKNLAWGGYAAAAWVTVCMGLLFSGVFAEAKDNGAAMAIGMLILVPSVAGTAMSMGALEKRLPNPPFLKGSAYWNGALLAIYVVLMFVGNCR